MIVLHLPKKTRQACRWHILLAGIFVVGACSRAEHNGHNVNEVLTPDQTPMETFQEVGFFGDIKEEKWYDFVRAVQNNVAHSRKEPGNLSFRLYQSEDDKYQPIWFERFKSKEAHAHHKEQHYFKEAIKTIQQSLKGEPKAIELKELSEIPVVLPARVDSPGSRHVILLFDVKPDERQAFIDLMVEVYSSKRQSPGNVEFNLYQYATNPNQFVSIEAWESIADHEAHMKQNDIKKLSTLLKGLSVSDPMNTRWLVRDISE